MRPDPSVEQTSSSRLRRLPSPAHVERLDLSMIRLIVPLLILSLFPVLCFSSSLNEQEKDIFVAAKEYAPFGLKYEPSMEKYDRSVLPDGAVQLRYEYTGTKNPSGSVLSLDGLVVRESSKETATAVYYMQLSIALLKLKSQEITATERNVGVVLGEPMIVYSLTHKKKPLGTLTAAVFRNTYYYYRVIGANLGDDVWKTAIKPRIEMADSLLKQ